MNHSRQSLGLAIAVAIIIASSSPSLAIDATPLPPGWSEGSIQNLAAIAESGLSERSGHRWSVQQRRDLAEAGWSRFLSGDVPAEPADRLAWLKLGRYLGAVLDGSQRGAVVQRIVALKDSKLSLAEIYSATLAMASCGADTTTLASLTGGWTARVDWRQSDSAMDLANLAAVVQTRKPENWEKLPDEIVQHAWTQHLADPQGKMGSEDHTVLLAWTARYLKAEQKIKIRSQFDALIRSLEADPAPLATVSGLHWACLQSSMRYLGVEEKRIARLAHAWTERCDHWQTSIPANVIYLIQWIRKDPALKPERLSKGLARYMIGRLIEGDIISGSHAGLKWLAEIVTTDKDLQTLRTAVLDSNGVVRMPAARLIACAHAEARSVGKWNAELDRLLSDETLSAAQRVSLLRARAYAAAVSRTIGQITPYEARPWFEKALVATSDEALRLATIDDQFTMHLEAGEVEKAASFLKDLLQRPNLSSLKDSLTTYRTSIEQQQAYLARVQDRQVNRNDAAEIAELERRLAEARRQGNREKVARYERLLSGRGDSSD